ncbi:hypothetical protein BC831DRAFT_477987 [Entophlyctis helioformis]|nr:hypothetical protein BC831DRAFT_477987 [Entophlyctis helioformis]
MPGTFIAGSLTGCHRSCISPDLRLVHVATLKEGDSEAKYHEYGVSPKTHKVSLEVYRRASAKVMAVLAKAGGKFERASIDEAYLDITAQVNDLIETHGLAGLQRMYDGRVRAQDPQDPCMTGTAQDTLDNEIVPIVVWDSDTFQAGSTVSASKGWRDVQLFIGAQISRQIRARMVDELGYTCSTGIAHNKTLAKLVSAVNKPNKQTVVRHESVGDFMKTVPMTKIRGLGGKLGADVTDKFQVTLASDLWEFSESAMVQRLGNEQGRWLYSICRGMCTAQVQERKATKTMAACKSLRPALTDDAGSQRWLGVLAADLYCRVLDEYEASQRWPRRLILHYKTVSQLAERSKSCAFPSRSQLLSPDTITSKAWALLVAEAARYPCHQLSLTASGLETLENGGPMLATWLKAGENSTVHETANKGDETAVQDTELARCEVARDQDFSIDGESAATASLGDLANVVVDGDSAATVCEVCGERVALDDQSLQEHSDFHFAQSLSATAAQQQPQVLDERRHTTKTTAASAAKRSRKAKDGAANKGKRTKPNSESSKMPKMTDFFHPQ